MEIKVADVAELVDARDLKSLDGNVVWVRVPPPAPPPTRFATKISAGPRARERPADPVKYWLATAPCFMDLMKRMYPEHRHPETTMRSRFRQFTIVLGLLSATSAAGDAVAGTIVVFALP